MNNLALITGASGGIGLALATVHAQHGDDLLLVARSSDKLRELKNELEKKYHVKVHCLALDLALPNAGLDLFNIVSQSDLTVNYLINNAGFGDVGFLVENDWDKELQMINLNVITLTQLTKLFAQDMIKRGGGKIMNVASTAAFQSGPKMAIYFATKAYVLSFSEAVNNELCAQGVTVTALCPGPTQSGFNKVAGFNGGALKNSKIPTSQQVAEYGYNAMMAGKTVAIHGVMNTIMANVVRFIPRALAVKITRYFIEK
ncbi:MAG: SDR family oxidoreductase [Bacteroidia bacterium]|nr:SDR family oxidoreductase [Bacteroidia bacterium]